MLCDAGDAQQQKCDKYDDDHCDSHSTMFSAMAGGHHPGLARSGQHGENPEKEVPISIGALGAQATGNPDAR